MSERFLREDTEIVPSCCVVSVEDPLKQVTCWWDRCTGRDGCLRVPRISLAHVCALSWKPKVLQLVPLHTIGLKYIYLLFCALLKEDLPNLNLALFWGKMVFLLSCISTGWWCWWGLVVRVGGLVGSRFRAGTFEHPVDFVMWLDMDSNSLKLQAFGCGYYYRCFFNVCCSCGDSWAVQCSCHFRTWLFFASHGQLDSYFLLLSGENDW